MLGLAEGRVLLAHDMLLGVHVSTCRIVVLAREFSWLIQRVVRLVAEGMLLGEHVRVVCLVSSGLRVVIGRYRSVDGTTESVVALNLARVRMRDLSDGHAKSPSLWGNSVVGRYRNLRHESFMTSVLGLVDWLIWCGLRKSLRLRSIRLGLRLLVLRLRLLVLRLRLLVLRLGPGLGLRLLVLRLGYGLWVRRLRLVRLGFSLLVLGLVLGLLVLGLLVLGLLVLRLLVLGLLVLLRLRGRLTSPGSRLGWIKILSDGLLDVGWLSRSRCRLPLLWSSLSLGLSLRLSLRLSLGLSLRLPFRLPLGLSLRLSLRLPLGLPLRLSLRLPLGLSLRLFLLMLGLDRLLRSPLLILIPLVLDFRRLLVNRLGSLVAASMRPVFVRRPALLIMFRRRLMGSSLWMR